MRLAPLRSTRVYLNINGRYDRPKISHKLQVNVPRTMGILRDAIQKLLHVTINWLFNYKWFQLHFIEIVTL